MNYQKNSIIKDKIETNINFDNTFIWTKKWTKKMNKNKGMYMFNKWTKKIKPITNYNHVTLKQTEGCNTYKKSKMKRKI